MNDDPVYLPETDSLKLNEGELEVIGKLMKSPKSRFQEILTAYFSNSPNPSLAWKRLDEIFMYYYNTTLPVVHPFTYAMGNLNIIFEIMDKIKPSSRRKLGRSGSFTLSKEIRLVFEKYLFNGSRKVDQDKKVNRIREIAYAYLKKTEMDEVRYNATKLSCILSNEFGEKLGIKQSTILYYVKRQRVLENSLSKVLFNSISKLSLT